MKSLFSGLFLCLIVCSVQAQKAPIKFGDIPMEDMKMNSYEKDSSASAVILVDYGQSTIVYRQNVGFTLDFERITRIKILNKEGLKWGDFTIPLYKSGSTDEKLTSLKAVTYNLEDGKVVETKLKNEGIFKENFDATRDLIKVTCPNVREGSVVEITYKVNSEFLFNFQDWDFQSSIPTVLSEYRAQIPEYFTYDKYMQGYVSLDISDETKTPNTIRLTSFERTGRYNTQSTANTDQINFIDVKNRWVSNHVPAFKQEPFMTSVSNYISKINFELAFIKYPNEPIKQYMGSWADINKSFAEHENFGGEIKGNAFLKNIVEEITTGLSSPEEKIGAICHYVKQNVIWDGSQRKYSVLPFKKVLENKKGNSAEINLLLACMLEKAEIEVIPVLLSTRDHGLVRETSPVSSQFNYVICLARVNDKTLLLDATEKLLPTGMLPERCLNGRGFGVSPDGFKWIALETKQKTKIASTADLILSQSGELTGKLKCDRSGYAALNKRKKYLIEGEKEYIKEFVGSHAWDIKSSEIQNAEEIQNNFIEVHDLIVNENMTLAGDNIYLDPFIIAAQKNNPFKSEMRQYPVDFGSPSDETLVFKLTLPENYVVDELPKSKVIAMPQNGARYLYNVSQIGNQILVTSLFQINKSLFTQEEYPFLREFYSQIIAKQAEQIVLKRK